MAGVAHPPVIEVPLGGALEGTVITIRPWTMGLRAQLRPKVAAVLRELAALRSAGAQLEDQLITLFLEAEEVATQVVRATIPTDDLSADQWDRMLWEDMPALAQAIWDLNIQREDGGGVGGKIIAVMGPAMARRNLAAEVASAVEAAKAEEQTEGKNSKTPTPLRPAASAS
jgi:hypothetical protein